MEQKLNNALNWCERNEDNIIAWTWSFLIVAGIFWFGAK